MKQKTVYHCKTFAVQQFVYDKIGLEDSFPSDKPDKECILELNGRIEAMAREVYPWLFENVELIDRNQPLPIQQVDAMPKPDVVTLEEQIRSCKSLSVLGIYDKIIDKTKDPKEKTRLYLIYDEVYNELNQTETVK